MAEFSRPARCQIRTRLAVVAICSVVAASGVAASALAAVPAATRSPELPVYQNTHYSFAERAADLVSRMTLAEKAVELRSNMAKPPAGDNAIPRLGVHQYTYWNEGQHGVNTLGGDTNPGSATGDVHATSFPTNFASTMSWDPSLVYAESTAISDEARGFLDKSLWNTGQNNIGPSPSDYGSLTYWAPTVNLDRDPRWGRTDEAFGEDPYLAGRMAGAFVNGYQGQSMDGRPLTGYLKVAATAKHYLMNNVEGNRMTGSSNTSDANIRDYYTAQFQNLTEQDHVSGVMTSYNAVNGTPSVADTYTANELLQRTYGFNGYITSDCGAVGTTYKNPDSTVYPAGHGWAPPGWTTDHGDANAVWTNNATGQQVSGAAGGEAWALRAGTDLTCRAPAASEANPANIQQAIQAGVLSEGVIDNALVHVFATRMATGEFDPPSQVSYTKITKSAIQSPAHQALARKVADEDLVLLKNDTLAGTGRPLLPVDASKLNNVVIVGNLANAVTLGDYSGDPSLQISAVQGITEAVRAANPNAQVTFDGCGTSTTATTPASCSPATVAAMKSADLVVAFAGTDLKVATEGLDRSSLAMPGNYNSLLSQVAAVGNPRTALVIQSGGPVDISGIQRDFPSIVFSGYNGESQGSALGDALTGAQNPSGHLDFTWYKDDSQLPDMQNYGLTPSETGGLGRTEMYFTGTPTYPFGYGLSYSRFAYSHVTANPSVAANGSVAVNFDVTNTSQTAGATVAQLYAAPTFTVPGVELPIKRLVGFQKTAVLQPGQSQHITLTLRAAKLSLWDEAQLKQVVYDGAYQFQVGASSADIAAAPVVEVHGSLTPRVQHVTVQPDQVVFKPGDTLDLTGKNPWLADDTDPTLQQPHAEADHIVEAVNNDQSFADLAKASVRYASSNPQVVTVSPAGKFTTLAPGVATISVTVDGVTGTTPIVVQDPYALTTPAAVSPGSTITVTTTLTNTDQRPVRDLQQTLAVPVGWTATAVSPATFATVAPGQSAVTAWAISVPVDAATGSYQPSATASFDDGAGGYTEDAAAETSIG